MGKKQFIAALCLMLLLCLSGCGSAAEYFEESSTLDDTCPYVTINGTVYCDTGNAIPVEPDENTIVYEELPLEGGASEERISAYAFISTENDREMLVCLIHGEWYEFEAR